MNINVRKKTEIMQQKIEISAELEKFCGNASLRDIGEGYAARYKHLLIGNLKTECSDLRIGEFLKEYIPLIKSEHIPILSQNQNMKLLKFWKRDDSSIRTLISLMKNIRFNAADSEPFDKIFKLLFYCVRSFHINVRCLTALLRKVSNKGRSRELYLHALHMAMDIMEINNYLYSKADYLKEFKFDGVPYDIDLFKSNNIDRMDDFLTIMESFLHYYPDNIKETLGLLEALDMDKKSMFRIVLNTLKDCRLIQTYLNWIFRLPVPVLQRFGMAEILDFFKIYRLCPQLFHKRLEEILASGKVEAYHESTLLDLFLHDYHFPRILLSIDNILLSIDNREYLRWVANGNDIRKYPKLPFRMTKSASSILMNLHITDDGDILKGLSGLATLFYAQLRANDMEQAFAYKAAWMLCRPTLAGKEYWMKVMVQLNQLAFPKERLDVCIDYLRGSDGEVDLKKISLRKLNQDIDLWHDSMAMNHLLKIKRKNNKPFTAVPEDGFTLKKNDEVYVIKQIMTPWELYLEGRDMRHCVFSYLNCCRKGIISIFTLYKQVPSEGKVPLLTIELDNCTRRIVQARGMFNRMYQPMERQVMEEWAEEHRLELAA